MKEKSFDTTTDLFREPSAIFTIVKHLLEEFPEDQRVACVGCSSGEEVYSLLAAHRLANKGGAKLRVDGYDMNERMIKRAREGESRAYSPFTSQFRMAVITHGLEVQEGLDGMVRVRVPQEIKAQAHFAVWDITKQPLPNQYPIILCANVLYHYADRLRAHSIQEVLTNLARSLASDGYLVCESEAVKINSGEGFTNREYLEVLRGNPLLSDRGVKAIVSHRRNRNGTIEVVDKAKIFQLQSP